MGFIRKKDVENYEELVRGSLEAGPTTRERGREGERQRDESM
jgi:hypothetical protein